MTILFLSKHNIVTEQTSDIVISGAGLVTSLGRDCESTWQAVLRGQCGVGPLSAIESRLDPDLGGGEVRDPDLGPTVDTTNPREIQHLQIAFNEAIASAGLKNNLPNSTKRCAVVLGTSLHGMRNGGAFLRSGDSRDLKTFLAGAAVQSLAKNLHNVATTTTNCSACSSGLASITLGCSLLQSHEADIVIAGGYDPISEYAYAGFNSMRLVSDSTLRPFASTRNGMKLAEGYAIVVLERAEDADARRVKTIARIAGYGESCDAFHLSKPHPEGAGAAAAMQEALSKAQLKAEDIDMLVAHATATPDNDASEHAALAQVFGAHLLNTPVVGFKSHLGHSLGAAGAVDLILSAMAMRDQVVPPCANISDDDSEFSDMHVACGAPAKRSLQYTLNTSLGFGGANSCMILKKPKEAIDSDSIIATPVHTKKDMIRNEVVITGMGIVLPNAIGNEAFIQLAVKTDRQAYDGGTGAIPAERYEHLINARRTRRMSEFAKLCLAATAEAYRDSSIEDVTGFGQNCAGLVATTHAASEYCETYYRQLIDEGINSVNPMLFAEGVPNVASAHLSTNFSIKGFCQTLIGTRTAGLEALQLAAARISAGHWKQAVVVAGEEATDLVMQSYRNLFSKRSPHHGGEEFSISSGAIAFILERRDLAIKRGASIRAMLDKTAASFSPSHIAKTRIRCAQKAVKQLGQLDTLLSSGNGQHLDRIDAVVSKRNFTDARQMSIADACSTERLSVGPFASLASAVVNSIPSAGVVCSDYYGGVYATKISIPHEQVLP